MAAQELHLRNRSKDQRIPPPQPNVNTLRNPQPMVQHSFLNETGSVIGNKDQHLRVTNSIGNSSDIPQQLNKRNASSSKDQHPSGAALKSESLAEEKPDNNPNKTQFLKLDLGSNKPYHSPKTIPLVANLSQINGNKNSFAPPLLENIQRVESKHQIEEPPADCEDSQPRESSDPGTPYFHPINRPPNFLVTNRAYPYPYSSTELTHHSDPKLSPK